MQYHSTREASALAERLIRGETLLSALIGACKHELLLALCWQAAQSILGLSIPVFVFYFLEWVRDSDEPVATGVGWALAVPIVQGLAAIARHRSTTASHRAGMRARTGIITLTFLSAQQHTRGDGSDGDSQQAVGRFAELIGTGADHVQEFFTIAATLLLLPLEIVGAIAVLWFSVSLASLGALLCVGIVLLAQVRGGRRLETTQIEYDAEVAAFAAELSEACHGVLTIKLSGWTRHFLMCLGESLLNVERLGRTAAQQLATLTPVTNTSVDILSAIIVVLYVLAMDQDLSPSRVASYWIMLSILHARVLELPRAIKHFSVGFSALTRFESALLQNQEHAAHSQRRRNSKESLVGTAKGASLVLNPVVDFSAPNTNHTFVDAVDDRPLLETSRCKPDANNSLSMAVHTIWLRAVYEINQRRQEDTDPTFWSPRCQVAVSVVDGAFGQGDIPILNDINVRIGAGELVCLSGPVGSGKTTLLLGLAGETPSFSGQVEFRRQIDGIVDERRSPPSACAYVPQRPWLQSGTIQENIVFDQPGPLDEERYAAVLQACCLDADIERMAAGDATQVGDGGSNLSGGQRQRVSLARAAYSRAPLVLLDDVFSALDPAVASEVFTRCVIGLMSGRTRVLVTHSEWIAGHADAIFTIDEGAVTSTEVTGFDVTDEEKYEEAHNNTAPADQAVKLTSTDKARGASRGLGRILELLSTSVGGGWFSAGILSMFLAEMIVVQIGVLYLTNFAHLTEEGESPNKGFYIGIYVGSVVFENIAAICRNVIEVEGCYRSHYSLLNSLLDRIFRGDIAYWDRTTSAEVVHYFSRDAGACNSVTVKGTIEEAGYSYGYGIAIVIIACGVVPLFTPVALAVTALHLGLMRVMSAREARKFSANHLPLFSLFNDMLNGLPTIRAATAQLHIYTQFVTSLCDINKFSDATHALETNLFLCTDLLGAVFLGSLLLLIANDRDSIDSGSAAFAILNATFGAGIAHMQVLTKNEIDAVLDARERISDAAAPASASSNEPLDEKGPHPASLYDEQPEVGAAEVQFNQVTLQYDEGPEVITDFSLTIEAGSRVGVLGRTGSGKSTLFRALSGLMRPKYGTILLGGDDVVAMKEDELRAAIAMIPQHPHLFRGTLRYNLDPLGLLDDSALYAALERAQYRDCVTSLDVEIDSCGENLSAGEAQLVCLARAFARGARVILLDEATANLDDTLMERVELALAKCAGQVTVLQIAHQTSAVLPCVQIVVLNAGKIVESGAPSTLLEQGGHFAELWRCDTRRKRSSTTGQDVAQVRISAQAGQNVKPSRQSVESTV